MKTILSETEENFQNSNRKFNNSSGDIHHTGIGSKKPIKEKSSASVWAKAITIPFSILIIVCLFAFYSGKNRSKPIDWIYINALNGKQKIELPDGSKITIRKGSSVSYPSDFGQTRRYVQLRGEAYFEITNDNLIPFYVKTKNEITASSGSSFLIRSKDSVEVIIVSKGEVRLESNKTKGQYITVIAGHKAELIGNRIIQSSATSANYYSWTNEKLIFNQTPLIQVAEDIKNFYGIPVKISEGINHEAITITAQYNNRTLSEILDDIAFKTQLLVKNQGDSIFINNPPYNIKQSSNTSPVVRKKKVSWIQRIFGKK
jgi:ferric-dicitrate binding protein FerR (iron transport regulator)